MIIPFHVQQMLKRIRSKYSAEEIRENFSPSSEDLSRFRPVRQATADSLRSYWQKIIEAGSATLQDELLLADPETVSTVQAYSANIENMIGTVKVPVGLAGPLRINGLHAKGDFLIPLATTEAALVASYARGAAVASAAGGISTAVLYEGVLRAPAFVFASLLEAGSFIEWVVNNIDSLTRAAESTTRFGKLSSMEPVIDNNIVFLLCRFTTGDASGQNMVTIATDALCREIAASCPIKPRNWYIEGNFSGDKKGSFLGMLTGRGRKVSASVTIPAELVERALHTSVAGILDYGRVANLGSLLSGQLGAQAHYANGLAAFYIATGQDAACVAESAVGTTRMEDHDGDLYVSVTMPNILVGSVGGGTGLPSQSAGLRILGLQGDGNGPALAEVVAGLCLCGELSIVSAIAADEFSSAHERLARHRK